MKPGHLTLFACLALALAGLGCGDSDSNSGTSDAAPVVDAPPGEEMFQVEMVTTTGTVVIDVTRAWSPNGAARFRELVDDGFYDGCRFFRVVPGFVVQFGINGDPAVQAMWADRNIPDDPVVESNIRGFVSFAQTNSPNSRTTQLFINYSDNSRLDSMGFAPFGVVSSGITSVDAINSEYGESPSQNLINSQGNDYLDSNFPNLDSITTARVLP